VNFTREPIIETVITPREGCKLVVRSSKGNGQEEYLVDAVEVVSFGHSFFFRSLERPKSFIVPVSDYEILELKETRMALKNAPMERSIKIGGGRDAPPRLQREGAPADEYQESRPMERAPMPPMDRDRKSGRRRRGRRGGQRQDSHPSDTREPLPPLPEEPLSLDDSILPETPRAEEPHKAPSFISKLFPPPPTLIKETLSRYKPAEPEVPAAEESFEEPPLDHPVPREDESDESAEEE
jgi:hypothetical protein